MASIETDIRTLGASLEAAALADAGLSIETIRDQWADRKQHALNEHQAAGDALTAARADLNAAATERLSSNKYGHDSPEYAAAVLAHKAATEAHDRAAAQYNEVRKACYDTIGGYDERSRADMVALATAYRTAIAKHRPLGGALTTSDTSSKRASTVLNQAAQVYPSDWIAASNTHGPLKAKDTKGRAHYSQAAAQKKRVKHRRLLEPHSGPTPPPVHPGTNMVWDHDGPPDADGNPTWQAYWATVRRDPDWRSGKSVTGTPPRGYTERTETLKDGTEISVWARPKTRMVRGEITAEILIDKDTHHQAQDTPGFATATHEFAHRSEHINPALGKLQEAFLVRRTTNPDGTRQPLERYGRPGSSERVRPDAFTNRYIGKTYTHSADYQMSNGEHAPTHREVLSCGMESLFAGSNGALIGIGDYSDDPDMRHFILGTLSTA